MNSEFGFSITINLLINRLFCRKQQINKHLVCLFVVVFVMSKKYVCFLIVKTDLVSSISLLLPKHLPQHILNKQFVTLLDLWPPSFWSKQIYIDSTNVYHSATWSNSRNSLKNPWLSKTWKLKRRWESIVK